jgi:hypothetical protein
MPTPTGLAVGDDVVQFAEVDLAGGLGQLKMQAVAVLLLFDLAQLVVKNHRILRPGRMHMDDVRGLTTGPQRSQHRHHGGDAAAGRDEQDCFRGRVRQCEVAFGRLQADDGARFDAVDQVGGQEALGGGLHGDRDVLFAAFGNRSQ